MPRAETTGRRLMAAMATEALSITRLMIISATSFWTGTLSDGDAGHLPGELVLALQQRLRRVDLDRVQLQARFSLISGGLARCAPPPSVTRRTLRRVRRGATWGFRRNGV
jgi:hypothetical protein